MVSYRHRKIPTPLPPLLDWIEILFSCFGMTPQGKRQADFQRRLLLTDNLALQDRLKERFYGYVGSPRRSCASDRHTLSCNPNVLLQADGGCDDDDFEDEDDEGMFCGEFLLGSTVLAEVELESPVAEGHLSATPVRTPRRSLSRICPVENPELFSDQSSHSSTLDFWKSRFSSYSSLTSDSNLDFGQVHPIESDGSSSTSVSAVMSPSRRPDAVLFAPKTALSVYDETVHCPADPCGKKVRNGEILCSAARLPKSDRNQRSNESVISCDLGVNQVRKDDDSVNKTRTFPEDKHSNVELDRKKQPVVMDSSISECNADTVQSREEALTHQSNRKKSENPIQMKRAEPHIPVGGLSNSLPCNNLPVMSPKKNGHKQLYARSLTDQDFTELKGCLDLGFVFPPDHVPDLCETLPALEACYAVAHGAISPANLNEDPRPLSPCSPPVFHWRIASPGDQPQQVKDRLRHWAQAVALNVRQPC